MKLCQEPACNKTAKASRGWCWGHYERWRKYGDPQAPVAWYQGEPDSDRVLRRVELEGDCWAWQGSIAPNGYGKLGGSWAHRLSYETFVGPIPEGLDLDHLCRNRGCVNPDHLEPVTRKENLRRGLRGKRPRRTCPVCGFVTAVGAPLVKHVRAHARRLEVRR